MRKLNKVNTVNSNTVEAYKTCRCGCICRCNPAKASATGSVLGGKAGSKITCKK